MTTLDPMVIAAALVTVIAALVSGTVTVVNAVASAQDRKESRVARTTLQDTTNGVTKKADTLIEKTTEIHSLTNSNLSQVTARLDVALEKIDGQGKMIASLILERDVARTRVRVADAVAAQPGADTLKKIEENTKATAENTALPIVPKV